MDDPLLTGCFEGFRDLFGDGQSLLDRHGTPRNPLGQRRPFHQLHDDGVVLEVVDGSDIRMIEGRKNLSLTLETRHVVGIVRERSGEDFDRYVASEFRVPGAVDFAHAACPDRCKNLVRPQDGFRPREAW